MKIRDNITVVTTVIVLLVSSPQQLSPERNITIINKGELNKSSAKTISDTVYFLTKGIFITYSLIYY